MVLDTRTTESAVYLIDDRYPSSPKNPVPSGWDYDQRGSALSRQSERGFVHNFTTRKDGKYPMTMSRTFTVLNCKKASFLQNVQFKEGDGFFIEFYSTDGKTAICITQKDGMFYFGSRLIPCTANNRSYSISLEMDLDKKSAEVVINGVYYGSYPIEGNDLYKLKLGYKAGSVGSCNLVYTGLWINYLVCDRNNIRADMCMPYGWTDECKEGSSASSSFYYEGLDKYTYQLCASQNTPAAVSRSFDKTDGTVCFDVLYFTKNNDGENVSLSLLCGGKECVTVFDNGSRSYTKNVSTLREHHPFVWQRIRIHADTETGKALIWHNGKKCTTIDFDSKCSYFDGIRISYAPKNGGVMKFTDVFVYKVQPEPEDYPKPPVLPTRKKDIYTGMNICSLWREGSHYGWDQIVNFDENMPLLGPYDEGNPEVADWEIKWMAEHGLDCEFYCWYGNQEHAPFFKTNLSDAMENGHFYAKYGDMMKFALIWEASNSRSLTSLDDFKKYYVPYWIDHFFSDDRYFRIDGVAMLAIFGLNRLVKDLGGAEKVKECIDYLRGELIKIGYTGLAVMSNTPPGDVSVKSGMSAAYAYHWGYLGYDPNHQKSCIKGQINKDMLHVVPTLSVGYNDIAWRVADRVPYISIPDMTELLDWMQKDILAAYKDKEQEWQRKLLMFSTWNEFGEGTFMSPAGLNGFGYLNVMRKAVTQEGDDLESELPTKAAYDRLGYLYPRGRKMLVTPQTVPLNRDFTEVGVIDFSSEEAVAKNTVSMEMIDVQAEFKNGRLCGHSTSTDPQIILNVDFDSRDFDAVRLKLRTAEDCLDTTLLLDDPISWHLFFATDSEPELSWEKRRSAQLSRNTAFLFKNGSWKGKITKLRLDPISSIGVFEIESLTLLKKNTVDSVTYINGEKYNSHYPPKQEDGEVYVSFEPNLLFHKFMNMYYEWDEQTRTLLTEYDGERYYWTENCDVVKHNGKDIKLKKPLEFYDNLPYVPMSVLSMITDCTYTFDGEKLDITVK